MIKNVIKHLAMRRSRNQHFVKYNGVYVPKDRNLWTDDLERELIKARNRFM